MPPTPVLVHLTSAEVEDVRELARLGVAYDGVGPLSERFLLGLDEPGRHVLQRDPQGVLAAYGRVLADGSAELVVRPDARRMGLGTATLQQLRESGTPVKLWAHGDLPAARDFLRTSGLTKVRELHKMTRPLTAADAGDAISIPDGFTIRAFERARDEEAWLRVNREAFAQHPEQGQVTRADFDRLTEQPWFDPAGLLLLESTGRERVLAGSHWTKIDPAPQVVSRDGRFATAGEVYVVAIAPAFHGRGFAGPLTRAGLRYLAERRLSDVVLYVDGDNEPAMRTYRRLGFESILIDGMYISPASAEPAT